MTTTTLLSRSDFLRVGEFVDGAIRYSTAHYKNAAAGWLREKSMSSGRAHAPSHGPAAAPPSMDYHSWSDWLLWHCIGLHEQRGSGQYDTYGDGVAWGGSPAGGSPSSGYPGGLGIMRQAWTESMAAAGVTTSNGAYATPGEQILIARVILRRAGLHAWATAGICGG